MVFDNVNNYDTTQGLSEETIPLLYDEDMIRALYEAETLRPLGRDRSALLSGAGDRFQLYKRSKFAVDVISEGEAIPVSETTHDKVEVSLEWYGDAKQVTLQAAVSTFPFVLSDWNLDAVSALGENRDNVIMTELVAGAGETVYPGAKTSADIAVDDKISYEQMLKGRTLMRKKHLKPQTLIVSPEDEAVLLNDDKFISVTYGEANNVSSGLIGSILRMNVITTNAVTYSNEGSDDGIKVANNIMLSNQPFVYAQKQAPVFAMAEIPGVRNLGYDYAYYEAFGCKVDNEDGVTILKSSVGEVEESE